MFKNIEVLDSNKHASLKLSPVTAFSFAKQQNYAPISYTEMVFAAREYPIVFPKVDDPGKSSLPIVLLGITGDNHFVNEQGQWTGRYIPAHFRRYPFILGNSEKQDTFAIMIDTDSQYLSNDKGDALSTSDLKQTETLTKVIDFLKLFQQEAVLTMELVKTLRSSGVLIDQQINSNDQAVITGFEVIDPEKLNAVDDALFIHWRKQGLLPLIYAHLSSLDNIRNL